MFAITRITSVWSVVSTFERDFSKLTIVDNNSTLIRPRHDGLLWNIIYERFCCNIQYINIAKVKKKKKCHTDFHLWLNSKRHVYKDVLTLYTCGHLKSAHTNYVQPMNRYAKLANNSSKCIQVLIKYSNTYLKYFWENSSIMWGILNTFPDYICIWNQIVFSRILFLRFLFFFHFYIFSFH